MKKLAIGDKVRVIRGNEEGHIVKIDKNIVEIEKRIILLDFFCTHETRAGPALLLDLLAFPQNIGKGLIVGQIQVAITLNRQIGDSRVITHVMLKVLHEICRELGNADIEFTRKLLTHTTVGVHRGTGRVTRITFDDQYAAIEVRVIRQKPGHGSTIHGTANNDHVIALPGGFVLR